MNSLNIEIELGERTVMALLELAQALRQGGASPEPRDCSQSVGYSQPRWDWTPERLARIDEMVQQNVKPKNIMRALCEMPGAIGSRDAFQQKIMKARRRLGVPAHSQTKAALDGRHSVAA